MSAQDQVQLVLVTVEVIISDANSLKAKRSALNRIKDRVKTRFNASIAEVGELDKWQRATLAISMVSNERKKLQQETDKLEATLLSLTEVSISHFSKDWL